MSTQTFVGTLTIITCGKCGLTFGVPEVWRAQRRNDHQTFYCPNGDERWFPTGTSDLEKERQRVADLEQSLRYARSARQAADDQAAASERSARAYRGHMTRLRNRIADGICPVGGCRRNFANVKAHIQSQHPDWAHDHPEVLS